MATEGDHVKFHVDKEAIIGNEINSGVGDLFWKCFKELNISFCPQESPLHIATRQGDLHTVRHLIDEGTDFNMRDDHGVRITIIWIDQYTADLSLISLDRRSPPSFVIFGGVYSFCSLNYNSSITEAYQEDEYHLRFIRTLISFLSSSDNSPACGS